MTTTQTAEFFGTSVTILDHANARWLTAEEVGRCLGYAESNASQGVRNLYNRHSDEFTDIDTCQIKLIWQGQNREIRVFSSTGCIKLGFFANTARAKDFRTWAAKVLARPGARAEAGMEAPPEAATLLAVVQAMAQAQTQVLERVDRLCGVVEKLIETLPAILSAQRHRVRRPPIFEKDLPTIFALRDQGATVPDIVRATGFAQTNVWYVLEGRYVIMPGGRVKRTVAPTDVVSAVLRSQGGAA